MNAVASVSERLVAFMQDCMRQDLPTDVIHETKRLILNQFKASVGATNHPAIQMLHEWATADISGAGGAHVLWLGTETTPAHAAIVNGALFEVLDFHDTYIPCYMHAVSAVLPAVMAIAEREGKSGMQLLNALAIGLEVELAVATILMPTGYFRGYVPAGLTGGVGAAAACAVLAELDPVRMRQALSIAMCTAFGLYVSVGSMTLSYITGATARSGISAYELAKRGFDGPLAAFEGDKGMFVTHTDENPDKIDDVIASLGKTWRIFGQTYKVVPTETITHGPVECVLEILRRAQSRMIDRMSFKVEPIVVKIADERRERFGKPSSENEARFDLRFCAAAAWVRGRFGFMEMHEAAFTDPEILDLRDRVDLIADPNRTTFEGCSLTVSFTDGSTEFYNLDHFLGTPGARVSDDMLGRLFRDAAAGVLSASRADAIIDAIWTLEKSPDLKALLTLTTLD